MESMRSKLLNLKGIKLSILNDQNRLYLNASSAGTGHAIISEVGKDCFEVISSSAAPYDFSATYAIGAVVRIDNALFPKKKDIKCKG